MRLWRRWFAVVTAGEVVGFGVPAVVGALAFDLPAVAELVFLVAAGAVEGTVLGLAQAYVLRTALPGIPGGRWVRATVAGAVVAWLIGMIPATAGERLGDLPVALVMVGAPVLGIALLVSMGLFQWRVLRAHVPRASRWIGGTALGWLLGLGAFAAVTSPLWHEGQSTPAVAAVGLLGGVVMAAVAAAVSGAVLVRMVRDV